MKSRYNIYYILPSGKESFALQQTKQQLLLWIKRLEQNEILRITLITCAQII